MMKEERLKLIASDRWIGFPRADAALSRMRALEKMPRRTRMPGLLIHGASGMGKTMLAQKLKRDHPPVFNPARGILSTPVVLVQTPAIADERRLYMHLLAAMDAPIPPRSTLAELEVRTVYLMRDLGVRVVIIDEIHNLLAGTFREQRRFLNAIRFLTNELRVAIICLGVSEARDAIRGDVQLARRFEEHHLPEWQQGEEFTALIASILKGLPLDHASQLSQRALRQIVNVSGGITSIIFALFEDLAAQAIISGEDKITDTAAMSWRPGPEGPTVVGESSLPAYA